MYVQIKKTVRAGNSSAVVLPRSWLNKEVRIELLKKTPQTILSDVLTILNSHINLGEIIGIYLVGSYARGDEDHGSDMDILVLSNKVDKEIIHEGIYSILIISSELLNDKLDHDLLPIGPMLKEAKPLLNSAYLDSIDIKVTKKNVDWYLKTTEGKLNIIEQVLARVKNYKKELPAQLAYTLVLRIRTLQIIHMLINNKVYSKKEFIKLINSISQGTRAYGCYLSVKNDLLEENGISSEEVKRLYDYLVKQLKEVKLEIYPN